MVGALRAGSDIADAVLHTSRVLDVRQSLVQWNDAPDRTAEEVIDMLVIASMWEDE